MTAGRGYPIVPETGTESVSDRDLLSRYGPDAVAQPSHDKQTGEHRLVGDRPTDLAPPAPRPMTPAPPLGHPGSTRRVSWMWIGAVVAAAVVVVAAMAYFSLGDQDSDFSGDGATPGVIRFADQPASLWNVVGVGDVLNVRETPGLAAQLVTTLPSSAQGIASTGRRASADGLEWTEIVLAQDDATGWVAAQYLAADDASVLSSGG